MDNPSTQPSNAKKVKAPDNAYARQRVPAKQLLGGSYFAASYGGEHVAGGEFVVGVAFAAWGSSPSDVLLGLFIGNLFAVLSWGLICSPVATRARLTLYYYIERLAGRKFTFLYNLLNGLIFAVIAGGMITISASALRGLTDAPNQVHWYPTSSLFVLLALFMGAATIFVTILGFKGLAQFAKLCVPWLLVVFLVCGLGSLPFLIQIGDHAGVHGLDLFSHYIWTGHTPDGSPSYTIWQIAAFAWGLNLPLHLGMGDLSTLRFARKSSYGFFSVFAAYGGHFLAWLCAGVLGATTAAVVQKSIGSLDIGGVVVPILGVTGTAAVLISSLTTAVPSLYRAGLAFQSLFPKASIARVTIILGAVTTVVACSPIIFLKWLDLMAYFNIALAPIGAIICAEHFVLPQWGVAPFWRESREDRHNRAAWVTWAVGVILALVLIASDVIHIFFVFIPVWSTCFALYIVLGKIFGESGDERSVEAMYDDVYGEDKIPARVYVHRPPPAVLRGGYYHPLFIAAMVSLALMVIFALLLFIPKDPFAWKTAYQWGLALTSVSYFATMATWGSVMKKRQGENPVLL